MAGSVKVLKKREKDDSDVVEKATFIIIARRTRSGRLIAITEKAQAQALEEALEARESVSAVAVVTATTSRRR